MLPRVFMAVQLLHLVSTHSMIEDSSFGVVDRVEDAGRKNSLILSAGGGAVPARLEIAASWRDIALLAIRLRVASHDVCRCN